MLVGIDDKLYKEILDFSLYPSESSENYKEMLLDLKQRHLGQVLLFVSNGLKDLPEAMTYIFPKAQHQSCWTHIQGNILGRVRFRGETETTKATKHIYNADNPQVAQEHLKVFLEI